MVLPLSERYRQYLRPQRFPVNIRSPGHGAENQPVHQGASGEDVRPHGRDAINALRRNIAPVLPVPGHRIRGEITEPGVAEARKLKPSEVTILNPDMLRSHGVMDDRPDATVKAVKSLEQRSHKLCEPLSVRAIFFGNQAFEIAPWCELRRDIK